jgi:hypothetical protein
MIANKGYPLERKSIFSARTLAKPHRSSNSPRGRTDRYPQKMWISLWIIAELRVTSVLRAERSRSRLKIQQSFSPPKQRVTDKNRLPRGFLAAATDKGPRVWIV